jgi:hypothetical protein
VEPRRLLESVEVTEPREAELGPSNEGAGTSAPLPKVAIVQVVSASVSQTLMFESVVQLYLCLILNPLAGLVV